MSQPRTIIDKKQGSDKRPIVVVVKEDNHQKDHRFSSGEMERPIIIREYKKTQRPVEVVTPLWIRRQYYDDDSDESYEPQKTRKSKPRRSKNKGDGKEHHYHYVHYPRQPEIFVETSRPDNCLDWNFVYTRDNAGASETTMLFLDKITKIVEELKG